MSLKAPPQDPPFTGEAFTEALADFEAQRNERHKPITPTARTGRKTAKACAHL